jgi:hypothetical protein
MWKLLIVLMFLPQTVKAQVSDDFESGTTANWYGSVPGRWIASPDAPLAGSYSLRHVYDNPDAGTDQIGRDIRGLTLAASTTVWQFRIKHGYDPSSSNNWSVFLVSDAPPSEMVPGGKVNGIAVGVNFSGYDDTLRLIKVVNGSASQLVSSGVNWQTSIGTDSAALIRVERSLAGEWRIMLLDNAGVALADRSVTDLWSPRPVWFGLFYRYSSTRDRLLWFDDLTIEGTWIHDTIPPRVASVIPEGRERIRVRFTEEVDGDLLNPSLWSSGGSVGVPAAVLRPDQTSALLIFSDPFVNKLEYSVRVPALCDIAGNCSADTLCSFVYAVAEPGDIVISEIMADPLPAVGLPPLEYFELLNRSQFTLNMVDWKLGYNSTIVSLPQLSLAPGSYLILCSEQAAASLQVFGPVAGVKLFPALADGGAVLFLRDSCAMLISGVEYTSTWHDEPLKRDGGWSLEIVDAGYPFFAKGNWRSSMSRTGGTPGTANSVAGVNPDIEPLIVSNIFPADSVTLTISFNKGVSNFAPVLPGYSSGGVVFSSVSAVNPLNHKLSVTLSQPLSRGIIYSFLPPAALADYSGNFSAPVAVEFALPERVTPGDIRFNEILFDPWPDEHDFVEFVNVSDHCIDASTLLLVSQNPSTLSQSASYALSAEPRCILPGAYYAVTIDRQLLLDRFKSSDGSRINEVSSLPSLPEDGAKVFLYSRQLDLIDMMSYDKSMHFSLLTQTEGVSLEKVTPGGDSDNRQNWHSASSSAGWATPGTVNSIAAEVVPSGAGITLSGRRLTPDSDGIDDFIEIHFTSPSAENMITISIFDEKGYPVRKLVDNAYTGYEATYHWDGTADNGSLLPTGLYIVLVSYFDSSGKASTWKRAVALLHR